jgi:hypothetical protein
MDTLERARSGDCFWGAGMLLVGLALRDLRRSFQLDFWRLRVVRPVHRGSGAGVNEFSEPSPMTCWAVVNRSG